MRDVSPAAQFTSTEHLSDYIKATLELFPEPLATNYSLLPAEIIQQSEVTLKTLLSPSHQMEAIRSRLWMLIKERTKHNNSSRIQLSELAAGIAPLKYVEKCFEKQYMVAWCGVPTMDYNTRIEALLDKSYRRLNEILDTPLMDDKGKVDIKVAHLIIQVAKMVDLRSQGNYTERIESKTLQVNASAEQAQHLFQEKALSLEEINKRIALLEEGKVVEPVLSSSAEVIDV